MVSVDNLKKFKIFDDVAPAALEKLAGEMTQKNAPAGHVVCKEGDPGNSLYLIAQGRVTVEKKVFGESGGSKIVARLEPGNFFGEMSFLQGLPASATVTAAEDAALFVLSRGSLDELAKKDPKSALDHLFTVAAGLSTRLRSTTRELVTVYEVARAVGLSGSVSDLAAKTAGQLHFDLGGGSTVAFYRWNMFNAEYDLLSAFGPSASALPKTIETSASDITSTPNKVVSRIDMLDERQGLLVCETKTGFDAGERQMMETVASVMAPALSSAKHREEQESMERLKRNKETGYSF